jgi:hypothetical protein
VVAEPVLDRGARHRARRRARGQGIAGAALPDQDVHLRARGHARPLHVDAVREGGVVLDARAHAADEGLVEALGEDDAVRIAHRDRGDGEPLAVHVERDADRLAGGAGHGDLRRHERAATHLDGDEVHAAIDDVTAALDAPALGRHREDLALRVPVIPEVLREDAQAIARLLRLAAVRVQDAQPEIRPVPPRHEEQDPVRARAPIAVADPLDLALPDRLREVRLVDHDVVVAEAVALHEWDHERLLAPVRGKHRSYTRRHRLRTSLGSRWCATWWQSGGGRRGAAADPRPIGRARPRPCGYRRRDGRRARRPPRSASPPRARQRTGRGRTRAETRSPRRSPRPPRGVPGGGRGTRRPPTATSATSPSSVPSPSRAWTMVRPT